MKPLFNDKTIFWRCGEMGVTDYFGRIVGTYSGVSAISDQPATSELPYFRHMSFRNERLRTMAATIDALLTGAPITVPNPAKPEENVGVKADEHTKGEIKMHLGTIMQELEGYKLVRKRPDGLYEPTLGVLGRKRGQFESMVDVKTKTGYIPNKLRELGVQT